MDRSDGVRVLDLTRLLPGAYATLLLADLGAEVDQDRGSARRRQRCGPLRGGRAAISSALNRGKRSVTLDLRSPEAAAVLDALIAGADVVDRKLPAVDGAARLASTQARCARGIRG